MTHSSHKNYKTWIINSFETDKTAASGNLRLYLKSKQQVECQ